MKGEQTVTIKAPKSHQRDKSIVLRSVNANICHLKEKKKHYRIDRNLFISVGKATGNALAPLIVLLLP